MKAMNCKIQSDEQLVSLLQRCDKNAMGELNSRYHSLVLNKCLSISQNIDDASDMAQEVMLRVMKKINTFKGEAKFSTWLYSITFNYCIDQTRKSKKRSFESLNNFVNLTYHTEQDYLEPAENEIRTDVVDQALSAISEDDQNLLLMKYQFNKSIAEIQSMFNLSASTVKMRLLRARAKVSDCYYRMLPSHAA